ncbi:hypothetical protein F4778DRAFT_729851 [Xylariomycetidae sp. FL2044]|nr:hypothetical protein F4778DRAFT_729851 [Xylariomycetidae sp. FL2044]
MGGTSQRQDDWCGAIVGAAEDGCGMKFAQKSCGKKKDITRAVGFDGSKYYGLYGIDLNFWTESGKVDDWNCITKAIRTGTCMEVALPEYACRKVTG